MTAEVLALVARGLRAAARLLDPSGVDHINIIVDAGSPEQVEELSELISDVVNQRKGSAK